MNLVRFIKNQKLIFNKTRLFSNTPLGRWTINKDQDETNNTIDWANHDHCGSESCKLQDKELEENLKINVKEDKLFNKDTKK